MTITSTVTIILVLLLTLPYCRNAANNHSLAASKIATSGALKSITNIRNSVITESEQKKLTPDIVIEKLQEGNLNYQYNHLTLMDDTAMMHRTVKGQYPEAFILACMDSRVPVEEIFDRGIGDLFVGRVAGNIIDDDVLGSMEYGCKLAGAKLIVVLGHESCGAVKAAIEKEKLGNVTRLLTKLKPAIIASQQMPGEHNTTNPDFVAAVVQNNIHNSIKEIRSKSAVLKEMEDNGEIKIVGAYYNLHTGEVAFFKD